jgi:hypothetical protein
MIEKEGDAKILMVQVADFGFSTHIPPSDPDSLVFLPDSIPWTIPPGEYHHRGFTLQESFRSMVYSLGVVCLWLLFYNYVDAPGSNFARDTAGLTSRTMLTLSGLHLDSTTYFTGMTKHALTQFFRVALAIDPNERSTTVTPLLQLLRDAVAGLDKDTVDLESVVLKKPGPTSPLDPRYFACASFDVNYAP